MQVLVISDIHANYTAFQAVIDNSGKEWKKIWCLGDIIGYGPDPNECVELLRQYPHITLVGNHDHAALGKIDITAFNKDAKTAVEWTASVLNDDNRAYLEEQEPVLIEEGITLAHGSPRKPIWEYITDSYIAEENFEFYTTKHCLIGHTHYPVIYQHDSDLGATTRDADFENPIQLTDDIRMLLNPGSVGQPRDSDPRASFALLDLDTMTWQHKRVAYDVDSVQQRMVKANLPPRLIARLQYGW